MGKVELWKVTIRLSVYFKSVIVKFSLNIPGSAVVALKLLPICQILFTVIPQQRNDVKFFESLSSFDACQLKRRRNLQKATFRFSKQQRLQFITQLPSTQACSAQCIIDCRRRDLLSFRIATTMMQTAACYSFV